MISAQVLLSCNTLNHGCYGGNGLSAYSYIYNNTITDETCSPYRARSHLNGLKCSNTTLCKDCPGTGKDCFVPDNYNIYEVEEFGKVKGEEAMMQEIYQRGPITCEIAVPEDLHNNYTGGIYEDKTGAMKIAHDISVVGYGVESGVKYWLVRNSWGTYWGEDGFFRIVRGVNNINIESSCYWAVPKDTWSENKKHITTKEEKNDPNNEVKNSEGGDVPEFLQNDFSRFQTCRLSEPKLSKGVRINSPIKQLRADELPKEWDWRNVSEVNYLSVSKNQHIPIYCGSCWAFATTSALADRFHILQGPNYNPISLSAQAVVNCQPGGGSCHGGNPLDVYEFAYLHGIPDDTCQQYMSRDSHSDLCSPLQICQNCVPPIPKENEDGRVRCFPITRFTNYFVEQYGTVTGADKMKSEIYLRGPIECALEVTQSFHEYTGGIYEEYKQEWYLNHAVSIVGFGIENDVEFWIVRNSWGTYWGEEGYFRIRMHENNNGIEQDCTWAVPSFQKSETLSYIE